MTYLDLSDIFETVVETFFTTKCNIYASESQRVPNTVEIPMVPTTIKYADIPCSYEQKIFGQDSPLWELMENAKDTGVIMIPDKDQDIKEKEDFAEINGVKYEIVYITPPSVKSYKYLYVKSRNED